MRCKIIERYPEKEPRKKAAPSRRMSDKSTWKDIDIERVNELPFDIDGNK